MTITKSSDTIDPPKQSPEIVELRRRLKQGVLGHLLTLRSTVVEKTHGVAIIAELAALLREADLRLQEHGDTDAHPVRAKIFRALQSAPMPL